MTDLPPAPDLAEATCPKCLSALLRARWHVLPVLDYREHPDCAAPAGAGEHLCLACGRCGYIWAVQAGEGP